MRTTRALVLLLGIVIPLLFVLFTQHVWEDYYITFRPSKNLVEGQGLVYNPGDRLHTFTSPLGVLLPALAYWVTGAQSDAAALWVFRLVSLGFFAGSLWVLWRIAEEIKLGSRGKGVLFVLVLADAKLIDYTINGMETAILAFFAALTFRELVRQNGPKILTLAVGYAGLMWTRPDAFVLAGALSAGWILFASNGPRASKGPGEWSSKWVQLSQAVALGIALYLPWLLWTWSYYGTPVPHTITAKTNYTHLDNWLENLVLAPLRYLAGPSPMDELFMPAYSTGGNWPAALAMGMRLLAVLAGFAWLWKGLPTGARCASFALFLGCFYLSSIQTFGWYLPPWALLGYIALAATAERLEESLAGRWKSAVRAGVGVALCAQVLLLAAVAFEMRVQQRVIETGTRREIGLWLREHAKPTDTVFLEPAGYIGYFSGLKLYDWPGMTSREVVATIRSGKTTWAEIVRELRPDWLVLRPDEVANFPNLLETYALAKHWDARPEIEKYPILPGKDHIMFDSQFLAFRRK